MGKGCSANDFDSSGDPYLAFGVCLFALIELRSVLGGNEDISNNITY